jgi:hypothetical protein
MIQRKHGVAVRRERGGQVAVHYRVLAATRAEDYGGQARGGLQSWGLPLSPCY